MLEMEGIKKFCCVLILSSLGWLNGCSPQTGAAGPVHAPTQTATGAENQGPTAVAENRFPLIVENKKYRLQCIFHQSELKDESGEASNKIIDRISLRDERTGEEVAFQPPDKDDGLLFSQTYFQDVWSPDEEYLVLPLGVREGFCIIKAGETLASIKSRSYFDVIKVEYIRPKMEVRTSDLRHEFDKWKGSTVFSFKAGQDKDMLSFEYDFAGRKLFAVGRPGNDKVAKDENREIGRNRKGVVEVISQ
jgi:hypothetical protein